MLQLHIVLYCFCKHDRTFECHHKRILPSCFLILLLSYDHTHLLLLFSFLLERHNFLLKDFYLRAIYNILNIIVLADCTSSCFLTLKLCCNNFQIQLHSTCEAVILKSGMEKNYSSLCLYMNDIHLRLNLALLLSQ